jgi:hypothetical protein
MSTIVRDLILYSHFLDVLVGIVISPFRVALWLWRCVTPRKKGFGTDDRLATFAEVIERFGRGSYQADRYYELAHDADPEFADKADALLALLEDQK